MYKKYILPLILSLLCLSLFAGCSKESADQYVSGELAAIQENGTEIFSQILEDEIAQTTQLYTLEFPEELKTSYISFLQRAFNTMEFQVHKAKKSEKGTYSVDLSFAPIDFITTLEKSDTSYASSLSSSDLNAEVTALLKEDGKILQKDPKFDKEIMTTLTVTMEDGEFEISSEEWKKFLQKALQGYMQPYDKICELLDARDFMQSYLDACFKGDVTQFVKHTNRTEEDALKWYESDVFTPPKDLDPAYTDRYVAAAKAIMNQCQYTVGIPKKEEGLYNFTFHITYIPNLGFQKTIEEIEHGTFSSVKEVSRGLVETLEKYAATPAYGEEASMPVSLNLTNMLNSAEPDSEFQKLGASILPTE